MNKTKERREKVKAKVVTRVAMEIGKGNQDMEQIQDTVAKEVAEGTGIAIEDSRETVRLIIADFIKTAV